jgi:Flp pilus assembly protein TadG
MIGHTLRRRLRPRGRRSGQALVEFVLIAPILLLMIMGLVDFARAWQTHHAIADAAREGARILVVRDVTFTEAEATIRQRLADARLDAYNTTRLLVDFDPGTTPVGTGEPQKVTITYGYNFWILGPFMGWATGDRTVNLVSTITMRGE